MVFTATGKAKLKSDFIHFHKSCRVEKMGGPLFPVQAT